MLSTTLYTKLGEAVGTVDLPEALFGAPVNTAVLHQVVTAQLAGRQPIPLACDAPSPP